MVIVIILMLFIGACFPFHNFWSFCHNSRIPCVRDWNITMPPSYLLAARDMDQATLYQQRCDDPPMIKNANWLMLNFWCLGGLSLTKGHCVLADHEVELCQLSQYDYLPLTHPASRTAWAHSFITSLFIQKQCMQMYRRDSIDMTIKFSITCIVAQAESTGMESIIISKARCDDLAMWRLWWMRDYHRRSSSANFLQNIEARVKKPTIPSENWESQAPDRPSWKSTIRIDACLFE